MVTSDFRVEQTPVKVELRSVTTTSGVLCVMTSGGLLMQMWPADNWDCHQQVCKHVCIFLIMIQDIDL